MIYDGAVSAGTIFNSGHALFAIIIGALIILWILIGITNLGKVNIAAMTGLLLLTIILCVVIFRNGTPENAGSAMSFGAAVELSASMPLSWLPVIGDYTRDAREPIKAHWSVQSSMVLSVCGCSPSAWEHQSMPEHPILLKSVCGLASASQAF